MTMSIELEQMKYLVFAQEDLSSMIEGWILKTKNSIIVCWFFIEDFICYYGCI